MRFLFLLPLAMASSIAAANTPAPYLTGMTGAWDKSDGANGPMNIGPHHVPG